MIVAAAVLVMASACAGAQDPGLDTGNDGGPATTSDTVGSCPPGGPTAQQPVCLDGSGQAQRLEG